MLYQARIIAGYLFAVATSTSSGQPVGCYGGETASTSSPFLRWRHSARKGSATRMSETLTNRSTDKPADAGSRNQSNASGKPTESATSQGKTTIENAVVAKIADMAAREIPGVHDLTPKGAGKAISGMASNIARTVTGGGDSGQPTQVVNVTVGEIEAAVDLGMTVDYGESIPQVADAVRRNIMGRVEAMTGLKVKEVNIDVTDLYFPNAGGQGKAQVQ